MSWLFRSFAGAPTLSALAELHASHVAPALRLLGKPAPSPLSSRPLLLVAGEGNAGKASLVNYLCGQAVFPVRNKLGAGCLRIATADVRARSLLLDQAVGYLRDRDPGLAALLSEVPSSLAGEAVVHCFPAHGGHGFGLEAPGAGRMGGDGARGGYEGYGGDVEGVGGVGEGGDWSRGDREGRSLRSEGFARPGRSAHFAQETRDLAVQLRDSQAGPELFGTAQMAAGANGASGAGRETGGEFAAGRGLDQGSAAGPASASTVGPARNPTPHASRAFPFTVIKLPCISGVDKALRKPVLDFAKRAAARAAAIYVCLDADGGALPRSFLQLLECFLSDQADFLKTSFLLTRCDRLGTTADVLASVAHYSANLTRAFPYREFRFQMVCLPRFAEERARIAERRRHFLAQRAEEQARCLEVTSKDLGHIMAAAREIADMLELAGGPGVVGVGSAGIVGAGVPIAPTASVGPEVGGRAPWFAQTSALWGEGAGSGAEFGIGSERDSRAGPLASGPADPLTESGAALADSFSESTAGSVVHSVAASAVASAAAPASSAPRAVTIVSPSSGGQVRPGRRSRSPNLEVLRPPSPSGSRRSPVVLHRTPSTSPGRGRRPASAGGAREASRSLPTLLLSTGAPGSGPASASHAVSRVPAVSGAAGVSAASGASGPHNGVPHFLPSQARSISAKLQALQSEILSVSTAVTRSLAATELFEVGSGIDLPPLSTQSRRARSSRIGGSRGDALTASALAASSGFPAASGFVREADTMGFLLSQMEDLVVSLQGLVDAEVDSARRRVLADISAVGEELQRQQGIQKTVHRHNAWMRVLRAFALVVVVFWGAVLCLHTFDSGERAFGRCLVEAREGYAGSAYPGLRAKSCSFFYFSLTRGFDRFFAKPLFALFGWLVLGLFAALFVVTGVYYMQYPVAPEAYSAVSIAYEDVLLREAERLRDLDGRVGPEGARGAESADDEAA